MPSKKVGEEVKALYYKKALHFPFRHNGFLIDGIYFVYESAITIAPQVARLL